MKNKLQLTIVVCTYNRCAILVNCLTSLANQTADKGKFEVIVVNNNSTDDTEAVVSLFLKKYSIWRYFVELDQGLSSSRNRGFKESKGKYVAYIDDDAVANMDWVEEILNFAGSDYAPLAFGGPYDRMANRSIPKWFPDNYGKLNYGDEIVKVDLENICITGTNMIFRKDVLLCVGGFDEKLGMSGNKIGYGEEVDLQMRLINHNYSIYYVPRIKVSHLVNDFKLSLRWMLLNNYYLGVNSVNIKRSRYISVLFMMSDILGMFASIVFILTDKFQKFLYHFLAKFCYDYGMLTRKQDCAKK